MDECIALCTIMGEIWIWAADGLPKLPESKVLIQCVCVCVRPHMYPEYIYCKLFLIINCWGYIFGYRYISFNIYICNVVLLFTVVMAVFCFVHMLSQQLLISYCFVTAWLETGNFGLASFWPFLMQSLGWGQLWILQILSWPYYKDTLRSHWVRRINALITI